MHRELKTPKNYFLEGEREKKRHYDIKYLLSSDVCIKTTGFSHDTNNDKMYVDVIIPIGIQIPISASDNT